MLDGFGLHELVWGLADQTVSDIFAASPIDAQGRGILLRVREDGEPADLQGAMAHLVWTHRQTGKRGTTEFGEVATGALAFPAGCLLLNLTSGNLMQVSAETPDAFDSSSYAATVTGICNIYRPTGFQNISSGKDHGYPCRLQRKVTNHPPVWR